MSIVHKIYYKKAFSFQKLNEKLNISYLVVDNKTENLNYYYILGKSARGLDVSIEKGFIEIRNTTLSNKADYVLTNQIVFEILNFVSGNLYNEDGDLLTDQTIYNDFQINELLINDSSVVNILSKENNSIEIFCPIKNVHFGRRTFERFAHLNGVDLKNEVFKLIHKVQYELPNYPAGNIMRVGSDENAKIIKLITREVDYIIEKYDNIILYTEGDEMLMIDNETLISIIPKSWQLIDAIIIVAPILNEDEWQKLIEDATPFNMYNTFAHGS